MSRRDVVIMAGAVLAVTGPMIGMPRSFRARFRMEHPLVVQVVRYAIVGGLGTAANALVFLLLRNWWAALPANLLGLVLSTALSTEVNRRFTFDASVTHRWRNFVQTGATVLFYAFYSSAVLMVLAVIVDDPKPLLESAAVAGASVLGGIARFLVMRYWVFQAGEHRHPARA